MEIFRTIRKSFGRFCIHPSSEKSHSFNSRNITILVFCIIFIVSSIGFTFVHDECETAMDYSTSSYTLTTTILISVVMLVFVSNSSKIFNLIDDFKIFIGKRAADPIKQPIYKEANDSIEKWSRLLDFIMVKFTSNFLAIVNLLVTAVLYFTTDMTDDDWVMLLAFWLPFNWKTMPGYTVATFIVWLYSLIGLQTPSCVFLLLFGSCLISNAITSHIKKDLVSMDKNWKANQDPVELKTKVGEFIKNYATAAQFVTDLADILKYIFTIYALWGIVTICGTLLMLNNDKSETQIGELVAIIAKTFYSFLFVGIYCELSERIRDGFEEIPDAICNLDWYTYPMEVQRIIPTILHCAQQPVKLEAFGNIPFTRDTFKKIVNKGYSFFTVFREV